MVLPVVFDDAHDDGDALLVLDDVVVEHLPRLVGHVNYTCACVITCGEASRRRWGEPELLNLLKKFELFSESS